MLNLVKPKKNKKETMGERHKETKKDTVEMKVGCRFYEGAMHVPDAFLGGKHVGGWVHSHMWFSQGQADPAQPTSLS